PVVTRLYSPDDYGTLAVFLSIGYVLAVVSALRYEAAIPVPADGRTAADLVVVSFLAVLLTSLATGLILWLADEPILRWSGVRDGTAFVWLLPLYVLGAGVYQVLNSWSVRIGAFASLARTNLVQGVVTATSQIALGVPGLGALGLLLGATAGQASGGGNLARLAWRRDRDNLRGISVARVKRAALSYRRFALFGAPATLIDAIGLSMPLLFVAALYGPGVAGWFALAQRLLGRPVELLSAAVSNVYTNETARLAREDPAALPAQFRKVVLSMFLVTAPFVVAAALLAPATFPTIFGEDWAEAGVYVQVLAPMFLAHAMASPITGSLDILQRQDLYLVRELVRIGLLVVAVGTAVVFSAGAVVAILLLSVTGVISYAVYVGVSMYAIRHHNRRRIGAVRGA
ncbi:MAG: lipopolysaccharide biosynthesis protein, partial [Dehalococcoidia bacterium]